MDRHELKKRAQELYSDELQYAIARDDEIDLASLRARAALRLGREMEGGDMSIVWIGYIEGIARQAERAFEVDAATGQLRISGALRVGDLTFVPAAKARIRDWMALDDRRSAKLEEHRAAYTREHEAIASIVARMQEYGGDPTTAEACPDLFADEAVA